VRLQVVNRELSHAEHNPIGKTDVASGKRAEACQSSTVPSRKMAFTTFRIAVSRGRPRSLGAGSSGSISAHSSSVVLLA
jgi:hypothetical protein